MFRKTPLISETKQEKRAFYTHAIAISLPIIIQNLLSAAVSSADVVMLNNITRDNLFDKD